MPIHANVPLLNSTLLYTDANVARDMQGLVHSHRFSASVSVDRLRAVTLPHQLGTVGAPARGGQGAHPGKNQGGPCPPWKYQQLHSTQELTNVT